MTIPRQSFGLNKFANYFSACPANPDAVRVITIQKNNLAVTNGALTELELQLTGFYVTVSSASKMSFTLPGNSNAAVPLIVHDLGLTGSNIKFLALYPQFGTAGSTVGVSNEYVEWTNHSSLDSGTLLDASPVGPSYSTSSGLNVNNINSIEFAWGKNMSYTGGTGPLWMGTDGGLLKWDGTDMKLWNTLNSNSSSDIIRSIAVDTNSNIWLASNNGISYFNEISGFSKFYNEDNSTILSNNVNDIKILSSTKIVAATELGMSIFNMSLNTWESFDMYTTPELSDNNIKKISILDNKIFLGTDSGVFLYDTSTLTWNSTPFNSNNTPGWTAPDSVTSVASKGTYAYIGTTAGLIILPFSGGTAQTIMAGASGPISSNITSLRCVTYGANDKLYVGHDNGISVLDITSNVWEFTTNSSIYTGFLNGVNDLIPDFLSGSTSGQTIFFGTSAGNTASSGLYKVHTTGATYSIVPESTKSVNLLLTYPNTNSGLCASKQPIYFCFSKPMNISGFESSTVLSKNLSGSSDVVYGNWTWSANNQTAKFTPSPYSLEKSSPYNLTITSGPKSTDNSYLKERLNLGFYTENISPELGWNTLGKLMILSGTNDHYIQSIYLRNPHNFDVTINALIGII